MGKINNRDCRVTITVQDEQSGDSYDTKAFPTGQGPGLFSSPVTLGSDMHWIHVEIHEGRARVVGGNKLPGDAFQLESEHDDWVRLEAGLGTARYTVKRRYTITVDIAVTTSKLGAAVPASQPDTSSAKAMTDLLEGRPSPKPKAKNPKTRSAGQVKSLMRALGMRRGSSPGNR